MWSKIEGCTRLYGAFSFDENVWIGVNMSNRMKSIGVIVLAISFLMTGCKSKNTAETQVNPQAVFTSAAETAGAKMTEMFAITPTLVNPTMTGTSTATAEATSTPTLTGPTASLTLPALVGNLVDRAEFDSDVTVPDFSTFTPNQSFTKTWKLRNTGTSTWTTAYSLVFYSGTQMGGADSTPLYREVKPGDTIDLSVNLVSPSGYGQYTGYWILRNPLDKNFGVGTNADQAFYVIINVAASGTVMATTTPTVSAATLTPTQGTLSAVSTTSAPTPSGDEVSNVTLTPIGNTEYTGACNSYFMSFQVTITMAKDAQISYNVVVNANPEFQYSLQPGDQSNISMSKGANNRGFELHFTSSGSGKISIQITSPYSVTSNEVAFSVTCQ
jgi:hypothetical protein